MERTQMQVVDLLIANCMAYEAVILALMQTHPHPEDLQASTQRFAVEISTNGMTGSQPPGMQETFDTKVAQLLSVLRRSL